MESPRVLRGDDVEKFYGWVSVRKSLDPESFPGDTNPLDLLDEFHRDGPFSEVELAWFALRYQTDCCARKPDYEMPEEL